MNLIFYIRTLITVVFLSLSAGTAFAHQSWVSAEVVVKHGSGDFAPSPVVNGYFARLNCGQNLTAISGGWKVISDSDNNAKPFVFLTPQVFGPDNDEWIFSFNNNNEDITYTIKLEVFALCVQK